MTTAPAHSCTALFQRRRLRECRSDVFGHPSWTNCASYPNPRWRKMATRTLRRPATQAARSLRQPRGQQGRWRLDGFRTGELNSGARKRNGQLVTSAYSRARRAVCSRWRCFSQRSSSDREPSEHDLPGWPPTFSVSSRSRSAACGFALAFTCRSRSFTWPTPPADDRPLGAAVSFQFGCGVPSLPIADLASGSLRQLVDVCLVDELIDFGVYLQNSGLGPPEFKKKEGACSDSKWADRQSHACPCRPGSNVGNRRPRIFHIHRSSGSPTPS